MKYAIDCQHEVIRERAFMAFGHYIKNGLNLTEYLYENITVKIEPNSSQETL